MKTINEFTRKHVGLYADGTFGYSYVGKKVQSLAVEMGMDEAETVWDGEGFDEAMDVALAYLNNKTDGTVYFQFVEGDLLLLPEEEPS